MSDLVKLRLGDVGRKGKRLASGGTATREESQLKTRFSLLVRVRQSNAKLDCISRGHEVSRSYYYSFHGGRRKRENAFSRVSNACIASCIYSAFKCISSNPGYRDKMRKIQGRFRLHILCSTPARRASLISNNYQGLESAIEWFMVISMRYRAVRYS
jgi:hypothetical protein